MRLAFFLFNFISALLLFGAGVFCIGMAILDPRSAAAAAATLGGLLLIGPFGAWMLAEWAAFRRESLAGFRQATLFSLMFGSFLLFVAIVSRFGQAEVPPEKRPSMPMTIGLAALGGVYLAIGIVRRRALDALAASSETVPDEFEPDERSENAESRP